MGDRQKIKAKGKRLKAKAKGQKLKGIFFSYSLWPIAYCLNLTKEDADG